MVYMMLPVFHSIGQEGYIYWTVDAGDKLRAMSLVDLLNVFNTSLREDVMSFLFIETTLVER